MKIDYIDRNTVKKELFPFAASKADVYIGSFYKWIGYFTDDSPTPLCVAVLGQVTGKKNMHIFCFETRLDVRRCHAGTAFMQTLIEAGKETGLKSFDCSILQDDDTTGRAKFYVKNGFNVSENRLLAEYKIQ